MTILVVGATGSCGGALVERAIQRGRSVTALGRNDEKLRARFGHLGDRVRCRTVDLEDQREVERAIATHDAVVSGLASFERPHNQMSSFARRVIAAAAALRRPRLRFLTFGLCGAGEGGGWRAHALQGLVGVLSPFRFGPAIADHRRVLRLLEASSLDYTVFQTAQMTEGSSGRRYQSGSPEACPGAQPWHRLALFDAADVCLDALSHSNLPLLQMRYEGGRIG
ncbi:MAG: NAD(P)-binding oxidoreductase [Myxococcota bacterium]